MPLFLSGGTCSQGREDDSGIWSYRDLLWTYCGTHADHRVTKVRGLIILNRFNVLASPSLVLVYIIMVNDFICLHSGNVKEDVFNSNKASISSRD